MNLRHQVALLLIGLAALAPAATGPVMADEFLRGKTVNYIVATAAGGAYDGYARLTVRTMEKYLPGTSFVVVNRPGAGHLIGTNMIYAAKPDGLTIGTFNMGVIYSQLVGAKNAQFDLGKMSWIGKAATDKRVILVGIKTPYKKFEDMWNTKEPVSIAVSGVGSAGYSELQLLSKVFDINLKLLTGYSGNEDDLAIMRGEVGGKVGAMSGQGEMVRSGRGRYVLQMGGAKESGHGEMSYGPEIAKTVEQKAVIALMGSQGELIRVTAGPPGIPAERLAALRDAYRKAFADPQLLADAEKLHYSIDPLVGQDMEKMVMRALDQPPLIVAMLKDLHAQADKAK